MSVYLLLPVLGLVVFLAVRRLKRPELPLSNDPMIRVMEGAAADIARAGHQLTPWQAASRHTVQAGCLACGGAIFVTGEDGGPGVQVDITPPLGGAGGLTACPGEPPPMLRTA